MNKKVLTIDDSKTLRMLIGKHLAPFGIEMLQAENGIQGIQRARETSPDVILLDYNMPIMDGYHTLIELKQDPALKPQATKCESGSTTACTPAIRMGIYVGSHPKYPCPVPFAVIGM